LGGVKSCRKPLDGLGEQVVTFLGEKQVEILKLGIFPHRLCLILSEKKSLAGLSCFYKKAFSVN
jgi:hypothetical protein